jgi:hypothetical protein
MRSVTSNPPLHRIDLLVTENEVDLKLRILLHKIGYCGAKLQCPERHRRVHTQQSPRRRLQMGDCLIGGIDIGQNPRTLRKSKAEPEKAPSRIGNASVQFTREELRPSVSEAPVGICVR